MKVGDMVITPVGDGLIVDIGSFDSENLIISLTNGDGDSPADQEMFAVYKAEDCRLLKQGMKSLTIAFCTDKGEDVGAAASADVKEYGLESFRIVTPTGGEGGWPLVEFVGQPDKIDKYHRDYENA